MAIPTGATRVRLKTAPQRGQVLALAEIIAPHARHEVILVMMSRGFLATAPAFGLPVGDLNASRILSPKSGRTIAQISPPNSQNLGPDVRGAGAKRALIDC
jgi:hypothetical protein